MTTWLKLSYRSSLVYVASHIKKIVKKYSKIKRTMFWKVMTVTDDLQLTSALRSISVVWWCSWCSWWWEIATHTSGNKCIKHYHHTRWVTSKHHVHRRYHLYLKSCRQFYLKAILVSDWAKYIYWKWKTNILQDLYPLFHDL